MNSSHSAQSSDTSAIDPASFQVVRWGRTHYLDGWARQKGLVEERRKDSIPDTLVLTEHDPVYTIGVRKGASAHLKWTARQLAASGIEVHETNRGGDITYHGPGQMVGYPIISLRETRDLHAYLRNIEEVLIRTVAAFGLTATRRKGMTGIWIDQRKIAAIGVAVRSWIAYHGFALNVSTNLQHFSGIVPCGITDGSVTSLENELETTPLSTLVEQQIIKAFESVFYH